jgi:Zn2+/Cd2+-exporting ATPase
LAEDSALEAVSINTADQTVSVATFGKPAATEATTQVMTRIQEARAATRERPCKLLSGEDDCATCDTPLSAEELRNVTIQRAGPVTTIARVTCPTAPKFWRWAAFPLPRVVQRDVEFLEHADEADEWKPQLAAAILCGLFGLGGYLLRPSPLAIWSFILAYIAGGWFTSIEVWERLRKRAIDVHFLMLAVAAGSASIGAWNEGAILLFLFSLSGALEHFALGRTQREIRSLFKDTPKFAVVLGAGGHEVQMPVQNLLPGMRLLVKPGAQFPVDAEVVKGQTAADESSLTGEATPVEKGLGDTLLAGTLNLWGAVEAVVVRTMKESALEKIVRLIREAQQQKAPAQLFADRFGTYYTYAVLALSVLMFFAWWLGFGLRPFTHSAAGPSAFYRAMTLLVVASPCALVLSIPSAVLAAIAWSARRGILFRGGVAVEKLADIKVVALDKTGTLTTGELRVERVESFPAGREAEIAQLACSLERLSTHPLARAVTRFGKQQQLKTVDLTNFESVTGQGLRARRNGEVCVLGRREWVVSGAARGAADVPPTQPGFSEIWLSEGDLLGRVILRDDIRPAAQKVIEELRREGLRAVVLTGDRKATAEHLQQQLRLDDVRAELKPEDKVAIIQSFAKNNQHVAMIGDGVNDAPSLAAAYVGVAMGARGSDAALEQADVVLMHDRLENFLAAFRLSQRARRIIRQNLFISLGTVATLVIFALFGGIPLTVGVVGHEGSTVIVVMNSLRLLFQGKAA